MPMYRSAFERMNFGLTPPLVQRADVILGTDIPFDDEHLPAFEEALWAAVFEQNPHWRDSSAPSGCSTGWSSVMQTGAVTTIDEAAHKSFAWHSGLNGWLLPDGDTVTHDPDEAGRFTLHEIVELQKKHPGKQFSQVYPKLVSRVYNPDGSAAHLDEVEIRRDEFVLWGYGPRRDHFNVSLAYKRLELFGRERVTPFELPRSYGAGVPTEYERTQGWAWRLHRDEQWVLADSPDAARVAALARAVKVMQSDGHRNTGPYLSVKHNCKVVDKLSPSSATQ